MHKQGNRTPEELLQEYVASWAKEAGQVIRLAKLDEGRSLDKSENDKINRHLFAMLAIRVSDRQAAFGAPADRFGVSFEPAMLPRGPYVVDVGKRIFLRCASALHEFLCAPDIEDRVLRDKLRIALISRDAGSVAIITGGLVAIFGTSPAVAAIVAALLARIVVAPSVEVLCEEFDKAIKAVSRNSL